MSILRLASVLALASSVVGDYRLSIPSDGYARVIDAPTGIPLSSITLASWVNVTDFSNGVTPIFTYLAPDASSQISFFLRPDSIGILWGGPTPVPVVREEHVDRHPRLLWPFINDESLTRKKRDAVDYSGGLGNIENILAVGRQGRANNNWSPLSFVDVGEMGVADLDTSGSSHGENLHVLPNGRSSNSRSHAYNDWTNVPYELTMQESSRIDQDFPQSQHEPRIITNPSGNDGDFVYFNWNVPGGHQSQAIASSNQWSPLWNPTRKPTDQILQPSINSPKHSSVQVQEIIETEDKPPGKRPGQWSSDIIPVQLLNGGWGPISYNQDKNVIGLEPPKATTLPTPKPFFTFSTRPASTNHLTNPTSPVIPSTTQKPAIKFPIRTIKPFISRINAFKRPIPKPTGPPTTNQPEKQTTTKNLFRPRTPIKFRNTFTTTELPLNTDRNIAAETTTATITTTTTPPRTTTTQIPRSRIVPNHPRLTTKRYKSTMRSTTPSPSTTRRPLWMLINKPNYISSPPLEQSPPKTKLNTESITQESTTIPITATTTTMIKTTKPPQTTTPKPRTTSTENYPTRPIRIQVHPQKTKGTKSPQGSSTSFKPQLSIKTTDQSSTHKPIKSRNYTNKWTNKYTAASTINTVKKHYPQYFNMDSSHMEEFKRAMEPAPPVDDGAMAVVYSVPITDEDAFYKMYEMYQKEAKDENKSGVLLDELYREEAVQGDGYYLPHEDETNENDLVLLESKENFITYVESTPRSRITETKPDIISEDLAAANPTEEPIKPTKPRIEIVVTEKRNEFPSTTTTKLPNTSITQNRITTTQKSSPSDYITSGDDISLVDLYKPNEVIKPEPIPQPAYYQRPETLYHQQLPPSYGKPDKTNTKRQNSPQNIIYQESQPIPEAVPIMEQLPYEHVDVLSQSEPEDEFLELVFSSNPEELIAQGFVPRPIHTVNTQEEAERWMTEQYAHNNAQIPEIYTYDDDIETFSFPETLEDVSDSSLNVNFRKMPFNFNNRQLYHIAFTWNSADHELDVYINGRLSGTLTDVMTESRELAPEGLIILGRTLLPDLTDFDPTSQLEGELSGVNMWGKELGANEIRKIFECNQEPTSHQVLAWQSTTMKFYKGAHLVPSQPICGAPQI